MVVPGHEVADAVALMHLGPPRAWALTSCPIASRTTRGPVRNIAAGRVMKMKSVSAGE
jgi:hypothetical protein